MNRRAFVRAVLASPLIAAVGLPRKYGQLDVATARAKGYWPADVFLNGQEIGSDVRVMDDVEGWVEVYVRNSEGHFHLNADHTDVVTERRYGQVRYVPHPERRKAFERLERRKKA